MQTCVPYIIPYVIHLVRNDFCALEVDGIVGGFNNVLLIYRVNMSNKIMSELNCNNIIIGAWL